MEEAWSPQEKQQRIGKYLQLFIFNEMLFGIRKYVWILPIILQLLFLSWLIDV